MTVSELKNLLDSYPDDMEVRVASEIVGERESPLNCAVSNYLGAVKPDDDILYSVTNFTDIGILRIRVWDKVKENFILEKLAYGRWWSDFASKFDETRNKTVTYGRALKILNEIEP